MTIKGPAKVDRITKLLVKRLNPGDIAVIDHAELDDVAANSLLEKRVKAVVNASSSLSDRYPNPGPQTLVSNGVYLLDSAGEAVMELLAEGKVIEIEDEKIICDGIVVAEGYALDLGQIISHMESVRNNMHEVISDFVSNTLEYARNEMGLINGSYTLPQIKTRLKDRHVLIVVRGQDYKEDLTAINTYIQEKKPVLIGVDGGADALMEFGYKPDLIVGDMDSVSDKVLSAGSEIVVHAYRDGKSPGMERIEKLGLKAGIFAAPGTSEDIALLMSYDNGADLIVLVGSHSNMLDFLEKGRKGMASTMLVRLKVGSVLVDAKGVSKLYRSKVRARYVAEVFLAAMLPFFVIIFLSPSLRQIVKLFFLQARVFLGF